MDRARSASHQNSSEEVTRMIQHHQDDVALVGALKSHRAIRGSWLLPHPTDRLIESEQDAILLFDESGVILGLVNASEWHTWQ